MFFQVPWVPEFIMKAFDYANIRRVFTSSRSGLAVGKISEDDIEAYIYALSRPGLY